ncbi:MAG: cupin domain-containing protein [Chloroflexi bacterium]|nr:cupin domain-containing protein [Chloroflexota bacterium]
MSDEVRQDYFRLDPTAETSDDFEPYIGPRSDFPIHDLGEGVGFQPVWGRSLLMNWVHFEPHRELPNHHHPEEQAGTIIEGEMELTVGGVTRRMRQGDVYVIPPNVPHSGRTFESGCVALDIFAPPRADFRALIERATGRSDD